MAHTGSDATTPDRYGWMVPIAAVVLGVAVALFIRARSPELEKPVTRSDLERWMKGAPELAVTPISFNGKPLESAAFNRRYGDTVYLTTLGTPRYSIIAKGPDAVSIRPFVKATEVAGEHGWKLIASPDRKACHAEGSDDSLIEVAKLEDGAVYPVAALGSGNERVAVCLSQPGGEPRPQMLVVARSTDGGKTWPDKINADEVRAHVTLSVEAARHQHLLWKRYDTLHWLDLDRALARGLEPIEVQVDKRLPFGRSLCVTERGVWHVRDSMLRIGADGTKMQLELPSRPHRFACAYERVAFSSDTGVYTCTADGCERLMTVPDVGTEVLGVAGNEVVLGVLVDDVLVVWQSTDGRRPSPKTYVLDGQGRTLSALMHWKGRWHAVLVGRQLALIPLPE